MATQQKKIPLTTEQAAKLLGWDPVTNKGGWTPATLRSWRQRDQGPPYYKPTGPRGKTVYHEDEVLAWSKANKVEPANG